MKKKPPTLSSTLKDESTNTKIKVIDDQNLTIQKFFLPTKFSTTFSLLSQVLGIEMENK